ncbi:AMP-binding protein [Alteromonas sp. 5E99-2]|uniref:AMP-binding protein n=1 Tax=Alteromonas sp. 5E99-2 TaxID=2817683 RepID=UPI001A9A2498|nr:AMP-binding protein [Alteromonas sp. 5E99-2]MBO1255634.1 AMP-binding protein [Alteromonas sp. 5E99-2]
MSDIAQKKDATFTSVLEKFYEWESTCPDRPFLHQPVNGEVNTYTWGMYADLARKIAQGIDELGLEQGSRIGILSKNCVEWFICDLAIMLSGHISTPIFATAGKETIEYVCEHANIQLMFVGKLDDSKNQVAAIPHTITTVGFPYPNVPAKMSWDNFLSDRCFSGSPLPQSEDISTIIYTSGSTGQPKGVVHTYGSINWSAEKMNGVLSFTEQDRVLSYLPLAHITERALVEIASYYSRKQIWFVESLDTFQRDMQVCRPTVFVSVPRLWTKFQLGILAKLSQVKLNVLLPLPLIGNAIKNKIKKGLGFDQTRLFGSGSAPLSPAIIQWYNSLGINITEGWGMTENCAYGTTCIPFRVDKIGAIGRIHPGIDLRISDESEIQVKGPCNMLEYYLEPDLTEKAFTEDGYFCTGDKGELDNDGYVKITGRLKDIFKTSKGKYVTPAPIEASLMANSDIEQVCVTGSCLPQPIALVVLSEEANNANLAHIDAKLEDQLETINASLESHQKLDRILICNEPWTVANHLLTPTLKVRRHELERQLAQAIQGQYIDEVVRLP